jgi:hypothetical protein
VYLLCWCCKSNIFYLLMLWFLILFSMEYCGSLCMYKCNHFEESATSMRSWHKPAFVPSNKRVTHEHVSKKKQMNAKH